MGVLCDYFRAADDAAAISLMEQTDGGPVAVAGESRLDAIDLKGIEPHVILGQLVALAADVPWQPRLVGTELLWSGGDEGPWMMSIEDTTRDTLAAIVPGARTSELSAQWGRIEELASPGPLPPEQLVPVIEEIAGLARRARDAGEHLYCWCCL
ncbi:hypothetical protein ACQP2Y_26750 [Actinoplanes sp. CA-051413]|uniref:hypothetical protein n=1 Tax=Actinoplanes sp. CA-051413 TaxID=3239899 RepID=UPI003D96F461